MFSKAIDHFLVVVDLFLRYKFFALSKTKVLGVRGTDFTKFMFIKRVVILRKFSFGKGYYRRKS